MKNSSDCSNSSRSLGVFVDAVIDIDSEILATLLFLPAFNWLNPSSPLKLPDDVQPAVSHGELAAYGTTQNDL